MMFDALCLWQEVVRHRIGCGLPAAIQFGGIFPLPSIHRRDLRRREVGLRGLRQRQAKCLSEHHGKSGSFFSLL